MSPNIIARWILLFSQIAFMSGCSSKSPSVLADDGGVCEPECDGIECGDDGCGGSCGECEQYLSSCDESSGQCEMEAVFMVPMRDDIKLRTKVHLPDQVPQQGLPTMMIRTPYRYEEYETYYGDMAELFVSRGYAAVVQDCRGRFDSEGVFRPMQDEFDDGYDTSEWIASQPWSNGNLGTIGGSYDGYSALAAAPNNPWIRVVVADDAPEDYAFDLKGGVVNTHLLSWLYSLEHYDWMSAAYVGIMTNTLDLDSLDEELLGTTDPFWQAFIEAETPASPSWDSCSLRERYAETCVPMLSVYSSQSGWLDPLNIWRGFAQEGCQEHQENQRLVMTADSHCFHLGALLYDSTPVNELMLDYIDKWLGEQDIDLSETPAVQYWSPPDNAFRGDTDWPPATIAEFLYLSNSSSSIQEGELVSSAPVSQQADQMTIDPEVDDPCFDPDYPTAMYMSEPFLEPMFITGTPTVELYVSASTVDADIFALLIEYNEEFPDEYAFISLAGVRARYRDGFDSSTPLIPGTPVLFTVETNPVTHEIQSGSHLMLLVYGGFCGYAENPHTGEPIDAQTSWESSTIHLYHDSDHPSRVVLPVSE